MDKIRHNIHYNRTILELTTTFDDFDQEEVVSTGQLVFRIVGAVICCSLIFTTLLGNILVITAVAKYRRLRSITNILLASLATADITVALLVMPFSVVFDIQRHWWFGPIVCHFWISCDVMCCTASILHLCVISLDRFLAITRPFRYRAYVSKKRIFLAIATIWICSATISFIPIFLGWYSDGTMSLTDDTNDCGLKVNRVYAVISASTSFYLPLPVMFYVYFKILLVAERQSREIRNLERTLKCGDHHTRKSLRRRSRQLITDTKAIRTLGIIMGVFCFCWLPFFLMYIILAYCPDCDLPYEARSGITWLGYFNSAFNPAVYAYLNKDFKEAFQRTLCCQHSTPNHSQDFNGCIDEISSIGRSMQRLDRLQIDAFTPDIRTPSLTPEASAWPSASPRRSTADGTDKVDDNMFL